MSSRILAKIIRMIKLHDGKHLSMMQNGLPYITDQLLKRLLSNYITLFSYSHQK